MTLLLEVGCCLCRPLVVRGGPVCKDHTDVRFVWPVSSAAGQEALGDEPEAHISVSTTALVFHILDVRKHCLLGGVSETQLNILEVHVRYLDMFSSVPILASHFIYMCSK